MGGGSAASEEAKPTSESAARACQAAPNRRTKLRQASAPTFLAYSSASPSLRRLPS